MGLWDEQITEFPTSALAAFASMAPWQLTAAAPSVVARLLDGLAEGYRVGDHIAIHVSATIEDGATIKGPAIVGPHCFIACGAYLRGGCWLEADGILGPGAELKSSFVFRGSRLAHFNFVGDSILGHDVNLEAGSVIANFRNERADRLISFLHKGERIETGTDKFGALVGDRTRIGANAVIAPGAILAPDTVVERLSLIDQDAGKNRG